MTCNEKREGLYQGSTERSSMPEQSEQQQPQRLMKLQRRVLHLQNKSGLLKEFTNHLW